MEGLQMSCFFCGADACYNSGKRESALAVWVFEKLMFSYSSIDY